MENDVKALAEMIKSASRIVFFGGAGISTESGIPDFRSESGLYSEKERKKYKYPPEVMLSHEFFTEHTKEFYDYYRHSLIFPDAKPNKAHYALAKLERIGKLSAVITQNVDGLHTEAGSKRVFELHGSALRNYCTRCEKFYPLEYILATEGVPKCQCGGIVKPEVVLYDEGLNDSVWEGAIKAVREADLMIVGGTSLTVYPAAGLVAYYGHLNLVIINKSRTPFDGEAALIINAAVGETLDAATAEL